MVKQRMKTKLQQPLYLKIRFHIHTLLTVQLLLWILHVNAIPGSDNISLRSNETVWCWCLTISWKYSFDYEGYAYTVKTMFVIYTLLDGKLSKVDVVIQHTMFITNVEDM